MIPERERHDLGNAVEKRSERRRRWEREGERPLARNLAMIGSLGWLIVTPTLIGVLVGRWLDGVFDTGITFAAALLFLGAAIGLWLAWKQMHQA